MKASLYCELNRPTQIEQDTQIGDMKRIPLPYKEPFELQEFHDALHAAIPKGKKYVIGVLMRRLSQHGDFTDYYTRRPEDWDRLEEMRGGKIIRASRSSEPLP